MVRSSHSIPEATPIEIVARFARHYKHGPRLQYNHLFFFSKSKVVCESLQIFGGKVYRQYGGWCWFCGKRKELIAIAKLLEPMDPVEMTNEIQQFVRAMCGKDDENEYDRQGKDDVV